MLFNRFLQLELPKRGIIIGGRQELVQGRVVHPTSMSIDVKHTTESTTNEGKLTCFNLSPETQKLIAREGDPVIVKAGYWPVGGAEFTGIVFQGQIRRVSSHMEGVESRTEFELGDGDDAVSKGRVRKQVGRASHQLIGNEVVAAFRVHGVKPGTIKIPAFTEPRSRTIDRQARRELDDICRQHDLTWSIQDGVLNVWPRSEPLKATGYVLEPDTGVIGAPTFTDKGVELRTLMLPDLRPGHTFLLRNDNVRNRAPETYMIEEVSFMGDNFGGDFGCDIVARTVNGKGRVTRSREQLQGART